MRQQTHIPPRPVDYEHQYETIINTGIRYFLWFGLPAVICVQILRLMAYGFRAGSAVQLATVAALCLVIACHRRLPFHYRMRLLVLCAMVYGAAGLATWGLMGTGLFLMFVGCILSALMGSSYIFGLGTALASVVITVLIGLAYTQGWLHLSTNANSYHLGFLPWFAAAASIGIVAIIITDRKKAEEQLRRSERRMAQIIDFLPDPTFVIDTHGKVIAWNRAMEELTGVEGADILGRGDYAYAVPFYGERRPIMIDLVQHWDAEIAQKYLHIREKNGILLSETKDPPFRMGNSHFWNTAGLIYDDDGQVVGAIESIRDITRQRAAEKALIEAEKRFRELVENLMVGVCIVQDDRPVYSNPHYRVICGPLAATAAFSALEVHPDDRRTFDEAYGSLAEGQTASFDTEFRLDAVEAAPESQSRLKWVHCIGCVIEHRQRPALLISMVDISHTKELEKMIRLREKMASLGQVSAGIAHEIRNPLSGINVLLDGIRENFQEPENAQDIQELITTAQKASAKISAVINRVLDFARPSAPCYEKLDINTPLNEAVALSQVTLRKAGVTLECDLGQSLPVIFADRQLLEQVILNLIANAAAAMKGNQRPKRIRVRSWSEKDGVCVSLADSGVGIPENVREKVFEPFYTTDADGSGIGLSICQRIVTDHGGSIDVADANLGGAEFKIKLPLDRRNLQK